MGAVIVVEAFPLGQLLLEIHVAAIAEQLVEFIFVGPMGAFDFAIELRRARLDVDVFHAQVGDVPVEERLELVTSIGSDGADPKREFLHDGVDEVDGVGLGVASINLERSYSCGVVDCRVLVATNRRALLTLERQELDVYLHMVAGNLLLVAVRVYGAPSDAVRESVEAMPLADPMDGRRTS